jgi:hypothetical protein
MLYVLLGRKSCLGVCTSGTYETDSTAYNMSVFVNTYFYAEVLTFPKTEELSSSRCQNGYLFLIPFRGQKFWSDVRMYLLPGTLCLVQVMIFIILCKGTDLL